MKRRTVKVAVWPVREETLFGNHPIFPDAAARDAFDASFTDLLNEVFAYQLNAWFDVNVNPDVSSPYFDGTTPGGPYVIRHGTKEKDMIDSHRDTAVDINVYLIDHAFYFSAPPTDPLYSDLAGSSYPPGFTGSTGYENCVVGSISALYTQMSQQEILLSIAHEIGHLMVGPGHPDNYKPENPEAGGFAPLQSLPESEHKKRLMYSGAPNPGRLLVKTEWDMAEVWLQNNVDGSNQ